jgi:hypothetical protein
MAKSQGKATEHIHYHRDGSIWARGPMIDGVATGYWEWFRKDGTKLRSGYVDAGAQAGEWTTYDSTGAVYKVTTIKPKEAAESAPKKKPAPPTGTKKTASRSKAAKPKTAAARKKTRPKTK